MATATDIVTYIGVALAVLGVLPILYTAISTVFKKWCVQHSLRQYDIEATLYTCLMSGKVDVEVAAFALTVLQRSDPKYWTSRPFDGSVHGVSWRNLNWIARPIEGRTIRPHVSDRLVLPEARTSFRDLLYYLGDHGCTTNPDGFWELQQHGLNVIPGICLVEQVMRGSRSVPILVVATPTTGNTRSLLLRVQNRPSRIHRGLYDPEPSLIRLQSTRPPYICYRDLKSAMNQS